MYPSHHNIIIINVQGWRTHIFISEDKKWPFCLPQWISVLRGRLNVSAHWSLKKEALALWFRGNWHWIILMCMSDVLHPCRVMLIQLQNISTGEIPTWRHAKFLFGVVACHDNNRSTPSKNRSPTVVPVYGLVAYFCFPSRALPKNNCWNHQSPTNLCIFCICITSGLLIEHRCHSHSCSCCSDNIPINVLHFCVHIASG